MVEDMLHCDKARKTAPIVFTSDQRITYSSVALYVCVCVCVCVCFDIMHKDMTNLANWQQMVNDRVKRRAHIHHARMPQLMHVH